MHGKAFASIDGYVIELTGNEWRINKLSGNAYASDSKNNYKAYNYIENNDTTSFVKLREKMKYVASQYANYARQGNIEEMTGMAYLARQLATNYDRKLTVAQNESIMEIVKSIGTIANHTIATLLNKTREELDKKTDKNSSGEKLISRNYRRYYKMHLRETDSKDLLEYFKPVSAKNIDWRLGGTTHPDHRFVRIAHMFHRSYKFRYDDGKITFSKSLPAGSAVCVSDGTVNGEWILLVDSVPVDIDMATGELRRGSELNKRFIAYQKRMAQYENEVAKHVNFFYNEIIMNEGGYAAISDSIIAYNYSVMMNNLGNGIAEYILYDNYPSFSFSQLDAAFRSNKINTASPLVQPAYNYYLCKKKRQPGMMYTDVELKGTDGKTHRLSDYVGKSKYVVIHFWSINSWFSRRAMSANKNIAKNYDDDKIKVIGVSLLDKESTWQNYIQSRRMTWTQLHAGSMESDAARAYGVTAMPETVIIDSEGRIVVEGLHGKDLELKVAELLGE
jgi:peroxiredoxin